MIPDDAVRRVFRLVARRDCTDARAEGTEGTSKGGKTCLSLSQHSPSGVIIRVEQPSKRRTYPYERRWTSTSGPKRSSLRSSSRASCTNDTNLGGDSDIDVVIRLASKLKPRVVALSGERLQEDGSHRFALERLQSFRDHAMVAMKARFGKAVKSGRKTPEAAQGQDPRRRRPRGDAEPKGRHRVLSPRRGTLGGELSATAPSAWIEEGKGRERALQEDRPHVQGGPEPVGQQAGAHQGGRSLIFHRVSALQRARRSLWIGAGADVLRHSELAEDHEAQ